MLEDTVMTALTENLPSEADQATLKARTSDQDVALKDLDLTSLNVVEICMHLEDTLGIEIDLDEFDKIESVSGLIAHCKELTAKG